jgi:hypothetical protein
MVYVRLAQGWTDGGGAAHGAGDMVDVDAVTLAELEANGVVTAPDLMNGAAVTASWPGPTAPRPEDEGRVVTARWPGPTAPHPDGDEGDGDADPWPGPTDPDPEPPQWPGPTSDDPEN